MARTPSTTSHRARALGPGPVEVGLRPGRRRVGQPRSCRSTPARRLTPAPTAGAAWSSPRSPGATGPGPAPGSRPRACSPRSAGPGRPGSSWIRSRDSGGVLAARRGHRRGRGLAGLRGDRHHGGLRRLSYVQATVHTPAGPATTSMAYAGVASDPGWHVYQLRLDGRRAGVLPRRGALPDRHRERTSRPGRGCTGRATMAAASCCSTWRSAATVPAVPRSHGAVPVRMLVDYVRVWA